VIRNKILIIICGPTAVGKTELSIKLALKFNGEIISADSMQFYKYMNIGTAKPDNYVLSKVKHYMIDICEPGEDFSAYNFINMAEKYIKEIYMKDKIPFIVGGTGLYIRSLIYGLSDAPGADKSIRDKLKNIALKEGLQFLYEKLKIIDPSYAEKISPNDYIRIIRALEVYEKRGLPFSYFCDKHIKNPKYNALKIGLILPRKILYEKINKRTDDMIKNGLIEETKNLIQKGISKEFLKRKAIGYADIIDYLEGKISIEKAIENIKKKTRNYAKRQLTWFKKEKDIKWFSPDNIFEIEKLIENWLKNYLMQN